MKKHLFLILALLCMVVQGAWAQTWTEVGDKDALNTAVQTDGAKIRLAKGIALSEKLEIASGKTVTIDLNGNKLDRGTPATDWYGMVIYNCGNLTITDCSGNDSGKITGGRSHNGGGILCESGSTLTVNGGTFTDNQAAYYSETYPHGRGGAIFMNPNSTLIVNGGKFENNTAYNGGAIYLDEEVTATISSKASFTGNTASYCGGAIYNKGTLTFNSGTLSGSTAPYGGAVYNTGSFTMADGTISNCQSTKGGGGGIVNIGTVEISGGTFSGNTANTDGGAIWNGNSGDIHGTLTITGGTITKNTATGGGGGIWTESTLNISGNPTITGNTVNDNANNLYLYGSDTKINVTDAFTTGANISVTVQKFNCVFTSGYGDHNSGTDPSTYFSDDASRATVALNADKEVYLEITNVETEEELNNAVSVGISDITLATDIALTNYVGIGSGKTVTLDLNGHTLSRNLSESTAYGNVIRVENGGTLTVKDSSRDNSGTITGGYDSNGGGICVHGTLYFQGGTITGCNGSSTGGAIHNDSDGSTYFEGGVIDNCWSKDCGGIYNAEGGTLYVSGGTIQNCTSQQGGGGVNNHGTATISGGTITGNHAKSRGGGVWNGESAKLTITGCTITGNTAETNGGGVFSYSSISMKGNINITGNTVNSNTNNLYLNGGSTKINLTGTLSGSNKIGVTLEGYNREITSRFVTYHLLISPSVYFSADESYVSVSSQSGEAKLNITDGLTYVERAWEGGNTDGKVVSKTKRCDSYQDLNGRTELGNGWYVATYSDTYDGNRWQVTGDAKLIIKDDVTLTCNKGIYIKDGCTLTIFAQGGGSGKLDCPTTSTDHAAIGGNNNAIGGNLVIHGGTVIAKAGHNNGAGIGGGDGDDTGMRSVTIYGGTVEAVGKSSGAGIGGGEHNDAVPTVTIYGGSVTATGGNYAAGIGGGEDRGNGVVKIYGGTVTASCNGYRGAGIGGGEKGDLDNPVYIYGGTVNATSGYYAAAIGGGYDGNQNATIYIYGGTVNATSEKSGAGIGGGYHDSDGGNGGPVEIYGGKVTAQGAYGSAGIGGGRQGDGGTITINGGTVNATGGDYGAGIGSGNGSSAGTVTINGGTVTATGGISAAGIGGGKNGSGAAVTINGGTVKAKGTTDATVPVTAIGGANGADNNTLELAANMKVYQESSNTTVTSANRVSACRTSNGYVLVSECDHSDGASYIKIDENEHHLTCKGDYCEGYDEAHTYGSDNHTCTGCKYEIPDPMTVILYMANSDGTDYDNGTTYSIQYGKNLPECSSVPADMAFVGWKETTTPPDGIVADNSELSSLRSSNEITVTADATYYARYQSTIWPGGGKGTASDPYLISTADHWNELVSAVSNKKYDFSGRYLQMTADISVSKMLGSSSDDKSFAGTFDGNGHTLNVNFNSSSEGLAPFSSVKGATIKNLRVSGNIYTNGSYAGGLIGVHKSGTTKVTNCRVSAYIRKYKNETSGGFVGYVSDGTVEIKGCVFDGKLRSDGIGKWGGFAGSKESLAKINFTDCLFMPSSVEVKTSDNCKTFCNSFVSYKNCFYTQTCGDTQGTQGYSISSGTSGLTLSYSGSNTNYGNNGIKAYSSALLFDGKYYCSGSANVTFTPKSDDGRTISALSTNKGTLTNNGDGSYKLAMASGNASVTATFGNYIVTLYDGTHDPTNTTTLVANDNYIANVTISGRTLYKDGNWNTLCLPFDIDDISTSPLADATIKELDVDDKWTMDNGQWIMDNESGTCQTGLDSDGTLYLCFKDAYEIEAGVPYLIKWASGSNITGPTFSNVEIEGADPETVTSTDGKVSFLGNYDPVTLTGGDKSLLYLGSGNQLYSPSKDRTINAFRAYFHVDLSSAPAGVRAFVLNFGEETTPTGLGHTEITEITESAGAWYDLQGRRISVPSVPSASSMLPKGVYIVNGKKVVIK